MFHAENSHVGDFEGGFGAEVSQKATNFKVSFVKQLLWWQLHHKRKTNYERFEENRNKLAIGYRLSAIGYRLSAIGYRLILGVLVSVCLLHVQIALAQTASNATYTWEVKNCSITIKSTMYYMDEFCGEKKSRKQAIKTVYKLPIGSFKATIDDSSPYAMLSCKSNALCNTVIKLNGVSNSLLCTNSDNGISFEPQNKKLKQLASAIEEEESRCSTGSSASQTNENQQRQGRQMCEAQKQTCLAACPSLRYSDGTWRIGNEASTCMSGCQSINCN